jgi:membrane dipeptidase
MAPSRLITALFAAVVLAAAPADNAKLLQKAKDIHKRIIAFDSHVDLPFDYAGASADGKAQIDLPKVERGQLKGAALAVFVPQGPRTPEGYAKAREDAQKKYGLIKAIAEQNPDRAALAYSPADVRRIAGQGKFAVVISMLNAYPLGSDLGRSMNGTSAGCASSATFMRGTTTGRIRRGRARRSATAAGARRPV